MTLPTRCLGLPVLNLGCEIRLIDVADWDEWLRMRRVLWPECSKARHRIEMNETLSLPEIRAVLVLERSEARLGGFLEIQIRKAVNNAAAQFVAYVEGWFVDEDLRRRGWGGKLLAAAEAWATEHGLREIASDTEMNNAASIQAHRRLGFEESYRLVHFLKEITSPKRTDEPD